MTLASPSKHHKRTLGGKRAAALKASEKIKKTVADIEQTEKDFCRSSKTKTETATVTGKKPKATTKRNMNLEDGESLVSKVSKYFGGTGADHIPKKSNKAKANKKRKRSHLQKRKSKSETTMQAPNTRARKRAQRCVNSTGPMVFSQRLSTRLTAEYEKEDSPVRPIMATRLYFTPVAHLPNTPLFSRVEMGYCNPL